MIILFFALLFAHNDVQQIESNFDYYEYQNVRDSKNNYFNLRVTYDICDEINNNDESRYLCKLHAYERAITIDA